MTRIIDSLADIAADYDALFCDLWGCVHNGLAASLKGKPFVTLAG